MKIAYIMSRFPKLTETFILLEMLEVLRGGIDLAVYPLIRQKEGLQHREVELLMPHVRFLPHLSPRVLWANLAMLLRYPARYIGALAELLLGHMKPAGGRFKSLVLFPKSVAIARAVDAGGFDLVHAHFATFPATAALIVKRLTGIPFTFTAHGSDIHAHEHLLETKVRDAAHVVAVSEYNRGFILDKVGERCGTRISVIHCGVQVEPGAENQPGPLVDPNRPCSIVCVGSFTECKGQRYLIDACARLNAHGIPFVCHLIGDGALRRVLEERIAVHGLGERFILHGSQPRSTVMRLLREADIAVLTSVQTERGDREGIPVALMEAMAAGLPVVASNLSGIPELVEHRTSGLLVEPRNSTDIAGALAELCSDPGLRRRLGNGARARVQCQFELKANARQLIELWQRRLQAER